MLNKITLWVFDRLAPLIRRLGVDYGQFRALLEVKLTLDARRLKFGSAPAGGSKKKPPNALGATAVFYAIMGLAMSSVLSKV